MSVMDNAVFAGLIAHFNTEENKALAAKSKELIAVMSPEKATGSAYSFFYGRDDNDQETTTFLEQYAKAEEALKRIKDALEAKRATVTAGSDKSPEEAREEMAALQPELKEFNSTRRQLIKTAEMLGLSDDEKKEFEDALVSAGKQKRGGATGGSRVRWDHLTVNGETVKNFTEAAKLIKGSSTADLTAAMLKAYGTTEWTTIRDNDPNVTFTVSDKDGKSFEISGELAEAKEAPATKSEAHDTEDSEEHEPTDQEIEDIDNEDVDEFEV